MNPVAIALLKSAGAAEVRHSGGTLLGHLAGVSKILERWSAPEDTQLAGLFHSVYGTSFFKGAIFTDDDRPRVRAAIGAKAEQLAWIFCVLDRASLYGLPANMPCVVIKRVDGGVPMIISRGQARALMTILWANTLEQDQRKSNYRSSQQTISALQRAESYLPPQAVAELRVFYTLPLENAVGCLLGIDAVTFLANHWPSKPGVFATDVSQLNGLVDYNFDQLVAMPKAFTKAFPGTPGDSVYAQPGCERELYEAGWTIYFHSLRTPTISRWINALANELHLIPEATRVSAFASKRGPGLAAHYDMNDNLVCQAAGTKRWLVAENTHVKNPTVGYTIGAAPTAAVLAEAPSGLPAEMPPSRVVDMQPGTVMFMPRGTWHSTETTTDASLHFNVQLGVANWKDVLEFALSRNGVYTEDLRAAINGDMVGDMVGDMCNKLLALVDSIRERGFDRAALAKFVAKKRSA